MSLLLGAILFFAERSLKTSTFLSNVMRRRPDLGSSTFVFRQVCFGQGVGGGQGL